MPDSWERVYIPEDLSAPPHLPSLQPAEKITRLVGFLLHLYGRYFLSALLSTAAPHHDRAMWCDLQRYQLYDQEIAGAALASMRHHL